MVTDAAVMAVVRVARPVFHGAHDGIAFTANAAFLAEGYSLCAVGVAALAGPLPAGEEKVEIDGWNSMDNRYAFFYSNEEEDKKKCILMDCLVNDDYLDIAAVDVATQHKLCNVNINSEYFQWTIEHFGLTYPPVAPFGYDDTFPAPGSGFYPHSGGTGGGSMHVGPNDPLFFPSDPSPTPGDPGSVPPGGRHDPIGPPDVPGFGPSRFVRRHPGGCAHPDLEFFQHGPDF